MSIIRQHYHKNFKIDDIVLIINTQSILDGSQGRVLAVFMHHAIDTYIIYIPETYESSGQKAILLPESCLELAI